MIIYSKFNTSRKPEFQLATYIGKDGKGLYSLKVAQNPEAIPFLNSLEDKYNYLSDNKFPIKIAKAVKVSDSEVKFPFIKGSSLEALLFQAFLTNDKNKFLELFQKYLNIIAKIPSCTSSITKDAEEYFGDTRFNNMKCIQLGCLDLNFDNLMVDTTDKIILIDYEWTFKFPIPQKYILYRSICSFYSRYRSYNPNKFVPMQELLKMISLSDAEKTLFLKMEIAFQKRVLKSSKNIYGKFEDFRKAHISLEKPAKKLDTIQERDTLIVNLNNQVATLQNEINAKNIALSQATSELDSFKNSKLWKIRQQLIKARQLVKK